MPFGAEAPVIVLGQAAWPGYSHYSLNETLETHEPITFGVGDQVVFVPSRYIGEGEEGVLGVLGQVTKLDGNTGIHVDMHVRCEVTNVRGHAENIVTRRDAFSGEAAEALVAALELFAEWPGRETYPALAAAVDDEADPVRFANIICSTIGLPLDLAAHALRADDVVERLRAATTFLERSIPPGARASAHSAEHRRAMARRIAGFAIHATSSIAVEVLSQSAAKMAGG